MADLVRATQARDVALRTAAQVELEFASSRQAQEAANREAEHYKSKASAQKKELAELQKYAPASSLDMSGIVFVRKLWCSRCDLMPIFQTAAGDRRRAGAAAADGREPAIEPERAG
jgi:hypothetical protein